MLVPDLDTIYSPTLGLPVNVTLSIPGWVTSACPVSAPPVTRLNTPGGNPISLISSDKRIADKLANSDGFITTVQPAARAGATFIAYIITGAFQGMIAATTPTGSLMLIY